MEQSSSDEDNIQRVAVDKAGNTVSQKASIINQTNQATVTKYNIQHHHYYQPQGNDPQHQGPNNQNYGGGNPPDAPDDRSPPSFPQQAEGDRAPENPAQECGEQESDDRTTSDSENLSFSEDTRVKELASSSKVDSTIPNMNQRKTEVDSDKVQDQKIIKTEEDNSGLGVFALFNVAERAEISIKAKEFGEAIAKLQQSKNKDFRAKFLLAECMLRMGSTTTGTVIKELAQIVKSDSPDITEKYLLDLGIFMLNNGEIAKAMVLFACTAFISNNVFQIGMCIYRLSEAIRKIPISKAKKKIAQSPLQKKFGLWSESFDQFDDLMNSMLNHMEIIGGAKLQKSQAFALNWMSAATYFIGHDFLSKAKEYSKKGLDISLKLGVGYHVERTRSDLYFNYGRAICILGDKPSGVEHIETSIKIADGVKDCPEDKKSDFDDSIKYKEQQLEYWKKRL
ncbi:uncharacterized protein LOC144430692 [Styela clava]